MAIFQVFLALLFGLCCEVSGFSIDNTKPRKDVHGNYMDVHDGNVVKFGDLYYWYGMGYTNCSLETGLIPPQNCPGIYLEYGKHCGFRLDHAVNLYTSPDLESWTFVKNIFPEAQRPTGIYFRPKVIFNEMSGQYVLWINHLPPAITPLVSYPDARLMVAISPTPDGLFEVVTEKANIEVSGGGDFNLMIDPKDKAAYLAYDAWGNGHAIVIEKLTDDYLDSLGSQASSGQITTSQNEAPILFERKGYYYLFYGHICCFCHQGSGIQVWTSKHPLGPWTDMHTDLNPDHLISGREIKAQCNYVIQVEPDMYLYTGDLWSSAPDGLKSHDIQYWSPPLEFDDSVEPPTIKTLSFVSNFEIP